MEVTATGYGEQLRRECMYKVLRDYGSLVRPSIYPDDSKFVLLATMCTMIDRSREVDQQRPTGPEKAPAWRLKELAATFATLDSGVSAPASLTERQRLRLMDNFVARSPFL